MGILGAGGIAETHLKAYRRAGADVVALAELDDGPRDARALAWGVPRSFRDFRDLLAESDIFALVLAAYHSADTDAPVTVGDVVGTLTDGASRRRSG